MNKLLLIGITILIASCSSGKKKRKISELQLTNHYAQADNWRIVDSLDLHYLEFNNVYDSVWYKEYKFGSTDVHFLYKVIAKENKDWKEAYEEEMDYQDAMEADAQLERNIY